LTLKEINPLGERTPADHGRLRNRSKSRARDDY